MEKVEILSYIKTKIPDYSNSTNVNKHLFQFIVYFYPFLFKGKNHWFIEHLIDTLYEIDKCVPDYSKIIIDRIATYGKSEGYQVFQTLGEVLVLRDLITIDGLDKKTIELEPRAKPSGKNPEYRMKIHGEWYAFEVKTPDLSAYSNFRQKGLQLTARMSTEEKNFLKSSREVVFAKDLKIQDYLMNAEAKFSEYKTKSEYEKDHTILIIIWDDYINEAISALKNPSSGLLTDNSFYKESKFDNVNGVIVLRHLHHLRHMFYYGEPLIYSPNCNKNPNVFVLADYDITRGVYFKNTFANNNINEKIIEKLNLYDFTDDFWMFTGEYQPTDMIDWNINIGITGLSYCSETLRKKVIELFANSKETNLNNILSKDVADFSVLNLQKIIEYSETEEQALNDLIHMLELTSKHILLNPKIETDISELNKMNRNLKKRFNKLKSTKLSDFCPCNSGYKYYDCCFNKLYKFTYDTFYKPL